MRYLFYIALLTATLIHPAATNANPYSFERWLNGFMKEALQQGISQNTLDDAFADTAPIERVIELDRKQPESILTLEEYLDKTVSPKRINDGKRLLQEHSLLLEKIGARYGVQPRFIVALWGIETNYGRNTGGFRTVDALATLAYDGRRSDYFRDELLNALQILEKEDMAANDMKGSWAGALGQCQFMPSSFLRYAVDYDKDGFHDIWESQPDVFASIANYLKSSGWNSQSGWGREVSLPDNFNHKLADIKREKTLSEWQKLGVRTVDGEALPSQPWKASLIFVGTGEDAIPYLIYSNYKVLLQWNRSRFFATAVGTLADNISH